MERYEPDILLRGDCVNMNKIGRDLFYNKLCASVLIPNRLRGIFYKWGGVKLGKNVSICARCFVGNDRLEIGNNTFINYDVWFNTAGGIKVGQNCDIAYGVTFVTSTHEIGDDRRRAGVSVSHGIEVGDGSWIGAGAMIMPGVKIGKGVMIGAGSVVTENCEENCMYGGNPAKMIKKFQ